jgi:hypothetical protein
MTPRKIRYMHLTMQIAGAILISACMLPPVSAQSDATIDTEVAAHENWRTFMAQNPALVQGCYRADYPSIVWEPTECREGSPRIRPAIRKPRRGGAEVVGNGDDYVAQAAGLISATHGTFPTVTDVTSEKSVGVALFGDGGILGSNEYSLQINTNFTGTTAACAGHSGCTVWQQFVYATDFIERGEAGVFIEYWLLGWGSSACPSGWESDGGGDCVINSSFVEAPDAKPTSLASLSLTGTATSGGNDSVVFNNGTTAFTLTAADSRVDIAQVWKQSEFNIVGDAGGSRADFNRGASVTVKIALTDGSTSAPTCVADAGSTGETNNLNLGSCSTASGSSPSIQFTESD